MNEEELKLLNEWGDMQICHNKDCHICKSFILSFGGLMIKLKGVKE